MEQQGACSLHFDAQTLTLTPESGGAIAFDLGDLDAVTAAEWELRLPLYTGRTLLLRQFGKSFETLAHDLSDAYRNRIVQCLLLEDMDELARFTAHCETPEIPSGPAEIRLYKSNLAVLPATGRSFQWRLADIDDVKFDSAAYEATLQSGNAVARFTRLAKRTEEFVTKLRQAMNVLATQTARALQGMFPFLDPDQLQSCATLLREGRSAPLAKLATIHKQIPVALAANAVDKDLKPYYEQLLARSANGLAYAGFKLIRSEAGDPGTEPAQNVAPDSDTESSIGDDDSANADAAAPQTLYWFFFPLLRPGTTALANVVAWEASSRAGRATYFFRLLDHADAAQLSDRARAEFALDTAIRRLNAVLAMLNFRRRPIYLSVDELDMDPRFHRYAIAARRLPEVREIRARFLGRALHTSPEAWQAQVDSILKSAS